MHGQKPSSHYQNMIFSNLQFHYNVDNSDSAIAIPFIRSLIDQEFYFVFDFNELPQKEGIISYYFSVSDNDVINRYKTTTSDNFIFQFPNREEVLDKDKEQFDALQANIDKSRELAKEIKKDLNKDKDLLAENQRLRMEKLYLKRMGHFLGPSFFL